jgi:hypothetical protein
MKPLTLLLAALLLVPSERSRADNTPVAAQQPAAGAICAVVVIVVGGVIVYKLAKFCQRKFSKPPDPPNTNDPPAGLVFTLDGPQPSYGGADTPATCPSCPVSFSPLVSDGSATTETAFQLTAYVDDSSGAPIAVMAASFVEPDSQQEDWTAFTADLAGWGLTLSPYQLGTSSYSVNGQPCEASQSPISFDAAGNVTVDLGGPLYNVLLERSSDLISWQPILQTFVPAQTPLVITDTSQERQNFYRVMAQ